MTTVSNEIPDSVTVHLKKPIMNGETKIASLTFREATAGDACLADVVQGEFTKALAIMSGMCGQPLPVLKQISMREITSIIAQVEPLMGEAAAVGGSTP